MIISGFPTTNSVPHIHHVLKIMWENKTRLIVLEMKEKKKTRDKNKFQDLLDTINENPFSYFLKPLDNVKDFPDKVVSGLEKLLESPFNDDNKP